MLPLPESFRDASDMRSERERGNALLAHLLQRNPREESRVIFGTSSTLVFLLQG